MSSHQSDFWKYSKEENAQTILKTKSYTTHSNIFSVQEDLDWANCLLMLKGSRPSFKIMNFDAIYLEFSKAFDKVDHVILVQKLQNIAIGGILLNWLKSFRSYWANSESLCEYFFSPMNQKLSVQYPKVKFLFYIIFYILYHQWRKCEALDSFFIHRWHKTEKYSCCCCRHFLSPRRFWPSLWMDYPKKTLKCKWNKVVHHPYGKNQELMFCSTYHSDTDEEKWTYFIIRVYGYGRYVVYISKTFYKQFYCFYFICF